MFQRRTKNKRGLVLSTQALATFAGLGCFVLHVGQEDRYAGWGEQIVSLSSRDGERRRR